MSPYLSIFFMSVHVCMNVLMGVSVCAGVCTHTHGGSPSLTLCTEAWSFIEFRGANIAGLANHLAPLILSLLPKC